MLRAFSKIWIVVVVAVFVVGGILAWQYWWAEKARAKECIDSGGIVSTAVCCKKVGDFPNTCLIGACSCSPEYSHKVKICNCGIDKCFNGNVCVSKYD